MTINGAKIRVAEEISLVEVPRKSAKMLDSRRFGVTWGLSASCMARLDGQKGRNRAPKFGIIDCVACRSTHCEVKWQIPALSTVLSALTGSTVVSRDTPFDSRQLLAVRLLAAT